MTRTEARELLMQLFFQMDMQREYSDEIRNKYLEDHFKEDPQQAYAEELCNAVTFHLEEIDRRLNDSSIRWNISRMAKVDLAITRLALGEVLYMDSIPDAVAINEAVDMAKKYSAEDSKKFINGVLGQIVKSKQ